MAIGLKSTVAAIACVFGMPVLATIGDLDEQQLRAMPHDALVAAILDDRRNGQCPACHCPSLSPPGSGTPGQTAEGTGTVPKVDPRAEDPGPPPPWKPQSGGAEDPGPPPPRKPQSGGLSKFDSGTGAQRDLYMGMYRVDQSVRCADLHRSTSPPWQLPTPCTWRAVDRGGTRRRWKRPSRGASDRGKRL